LWQVKSGFYSQSIFENLLNFIIGSKTLVVLVPFDTATKGVSYCPVSTKQKSDMPSLKWQAGYHSASGLQTSA
jgi:hypothetical protein